MFDFVRTHQKGVQIVLMAVIVPGFIAGGIVGYMDSNVKAGEIASVGSKKLTEQEFMQMLENNKDNLAQRYGADFMKNTSLINQFKVEAVNSLAVETWFKEQGISGSEKAAVAELSKLLGSPELKLLDSKGVIDPVKYQQHLAKINQTEEKLLAAVKKDTFERQHQALLQSINWTPKTSISILEEKMSLERQTRSKTFSVDASTLQPKERELDTWYQNHKQAFLTSEQADVSFIELKKDDTKITSGTTNTTVNITDAQIKEKYDTLLKNKDASIVKDEERSIRHILVAVPKGATPEADKIAKDKITAALTKITQGKNDPTLFQKLAKEISEDPGSKANGGDLGMINKGQMVPVFEKTAYELTQKNQVSGVIKSDFGYHILQLSDLKPAQTIAFEQAKTGLKEQLVAETTAQTGDKQFATQLEQFQATLEDQGDISFTAKKLNLPVQKFAKLFKNATLNTANNVNPLLTNQKVLDAVFSKDGQQKQASSAIEVSPGQWVSIQVENFYPATQPALKTVYDSVLKQWQQEKAGMNAQQQALAWFKKYQNQPQKALAELTTVPANWAHFMNQNQVQGLALSQKDWIALMSSKLPSLTIEEINPLNQNQTKSSYNVYYVDAQRTATFDENQKQQLTQTVQGLSSMIASASGFMPINYIKKELKVKIKF